MHISINTDAPLSDLDVRILSVLTGAIPTVSAEVVSSGTIKGTPEPAKPAAAKAAPKPKPKPEPEPEPEPMAEEPLPEEEPEVKAEEDDMSDEDLIALAVKKATEMVSGGDAAKVREALDAAGASRVRELNKDNVREFFRALS